MEKRDQRRSSTRRRFLAGVSAVGVLGLAGCGGSQSDPTSTGSGDVPAFEPDISGSPVTTTQSGLLPAPTLGPEDAPVTIMAFEDYACSHCQTYSLEIFPQIYADYVEPGDVHYEFHDFPIPINQSSERGANAARAVQHTVSDGAFWAYSKSLFENRGSLDPSTYGDLAEDVNADPETVRTAAVERSYSDTVQADRERGMDMGIQGTPAIFVDGTLLEGYSYDRISSAIDEALP